VGEGAEVTGSLVMRGACLGPGSRVHDSIIGPGYKVASNETVGASILANR
jgi:NDP-sugar pyrophosphorylase family protein